MKIWRKKQLYLSKINATTKNTPIKFGIKIHFFKLSLDVTNLWNKFNLSWMRAHVRTDYLTPLIYVGSD